jgi:EAL domain-containing protein (putative c-di-GMP-specific phosphodiesterase class I)
MTDDVGQAALERALDDKETLVLLYQPIHDARTGRIYSAEALLRQRRQDGQLREAAIIHEAAEDSCGSELFVLDHYLVKKAYADAAMWQREHDVRLNVNLSPRELQEGHVRERLSGLIDSCGIDLRKVNIEITETSYIEDPEGTVAVLDGLRELGVHLWLDDFGTAYSTLSHLQHFPVEGLKLSGDFVQPLPADARCRAIVGHVIALAHDVGIAVVAEEVENQSQLDFLLEHGCDFIQGFLFSKPMEAGDFAATLQGLPAPRGSSSGQ